MRCHTRRRCATQHTTGCTSFSTYCLFVICISSVQLCHTCRRCAIQHTGGSLDAWVALHTVYFNMYLLCTAASHVLEMRCTTHRRMHDFSTLCVHNMYLLNTAAPHTENAPATTTILHSNMLNSYTSVVKVYVLLRCIIGLLCCAVLCTDLGVLCIGLRSTPMKGEGQASSVPPRFFLWLFFALGSNLVHIHAALVTLQCLKLWFLKTLDHMNLKGQHKLHSSVTRVLIFTRKSGLVWWHVSSSREISSSRRKAAKFKPTTCHQICADDIEAKFKLASKAKSVELGWVDKETQNI